MEAKVRIPCRGDVVNPVKDSTNAAIQDKHVFFNLQLYVLDASRMFENAFEIKGAYAITLQEQLICQPVRTKMWR